MPEQGMQETCQEERRLEPPTGKTRITRQRYAELVQLGLRATEELEKHGLQQEEYYEFGRIMDRLMQLTK